MTFNQATRCIVSNGATMPTLGAECRFTGAFQTFGWNSAKVGS